MLDDTAERLDKECRAFGRYFLGEDPPPYVLRKYREAHDPERCGPGSGRGALDDTLLELARRGIFFLRLADTYASVFARRGALRQKMVLALAILESYGPTSAKVDVPSPGSPRSLFVELGLRIAAFLITLLGALAVVNLWRGVRVLRSASAGSRTPR
jgi:hypothetical protein